MNRLDLDNSTEADVKAEIDRLQKALDTGLTWPKKHRVYLHGCKETNWSEGEEELGLEGEAARTFAYTLYEVSVDLEVHKDGTAYATHFEGVELPTKVKV